MNGDSTDKLMYGQEVRLRQGVFDLKNLGKVVNSLVSTFKSEPGLFFETLGRVNADRDALPLVFTFCESFDIVKVTNCPGQELRKQKLALSRDHRPW
jgi:hypothetical protein